MIAEQSRTEVLSDKLDCLGCTDGGEGQQGYHGDQKQNPIYWLREGTHGDSVLEIPKRML